MTEEYYFIRTVTKKTKKYDRNISALLSLSNNIQQTGSFHQVATSECDKRCGWCDSKNLLIFPLGDLTVQMPIVCLTLIIRNSDSVTVAL